MSIEDQIATAWKRQIDTDGVDWASDSECFARGYLAGLRDLFVEVKPEDAKHRESYWCLTSGGWKVLKWLSGMEWWDCHSETAYRVSDVSMVMDHTSLPSPSDLFTENKFN